ncbi:MAG: hypothetical protein EZS28_010436 [Streblomastix strix]|uniref:Uncharacterized protein n=1 Tax=Streblomastix strix TaxID=222440 RepID=A0A5J4WGT6_9EUKA|nr:MAG: hypothetical protein EZS28_010436 [Streblomastix strix]
MLRPSGPPHIKDIVDKDPKAEMNKIQSKVKQQSSASKTKILGSQPNPKSKAKSNQTPTSSATAPNPKSKSNQTPTSSATAPNPKSKSNHTPTSSATAPNPKSKSNQTPTSSATAPNPKSKSNQTPTSSETAPKSKSDSTQIQPSSNNSTKEDESKYNKYDSLSLIVINSDNQENIIAEGVLEDINGYIQKYLEDDEFDSTIASQSLKFLFNALVFGSQQTQQQIQNTISTETLDQLKVKNNNENASMISSYFEDPEGVKELMEIQQMVSSRRNESNVELIKGGILKKLGDQMSKSVNKEGGEGLFKIVGEIFGQLDIVQSGAVQVVKEESDFLNQYVDLREKILDILGTIIKPATDNLQEGQQHPYLKPLTDDGTIKQLSKIIDNDDYQDHFCKIAEIFAQLFKAAPLPAEIKEKVVCKVEYNFKYDELCLLAECNEKSSYQNGHLDLIYYLLKFGTKEGLKDFAQVIQKKMEKLTDKYFDDVKKEERWGFNQNEAENKRQQINELIKKILGSSSDDKKVAQKKK